jgi:hypothetical protein
VFVPLDPHASGVFVAAGTMLRLEKGWCALVTRAGKDAGFYGWIRSWVVRPETLSSACWAGNLHRPDGGIEVRVMNTFLQDVRHNLHIMAKHLGFAFIAVAQVAGTSILVVLPLAWILSHPVRSQLFGVFKHDPLTLGMTTLAVAIVAPLAGWLPTRRATRIDPMVALRYE